MRQYWNSKGRIGTNAFDYIDGEAVDRAMKNSSPSKRRWIMKHATGYCGVTRELHKWGEKAS
jgi:hypothetical protein